MTPAATLTSELDHLDQLGARAFDGFQVRKDLVRTDSHQYPVPTYVVEFLLGRYCASTDPAEIEEGLQIVEKQLQGRTVRTGEEELAKGRAAFFTEEWRNFLIRLIGLEPTALAARAKKVVLLRMAPFVARCRTSSPWRCGLPLREHPLVGILPLRRNQRRSPWPCSSPAPPLLPALRSLEVSSFILRVMPTPRQRLIVESSDDTPNGDPEHIKRVLRESWGVWTTPEAQQSCASDSRPSAETI